MTQADPSAKPLDLPPRILVVDDDRTVCHLVRDTLEAAGFVVSTAADGPQALATVDRDGLPHLAVLDYMMPGMDGLELARHLGAFCDLPIILLSAVEDERVVVEAIQTCAEDYIVKPFRPRELVARVERVLRRVGFAGHAVGRQVALDEYLRVDFAHQQAWLDGQPVALTPVETKLLYILARNAGHTVTTGFLLKRLWPLEEVFEDALRVHIHRLRQKIEPDPRAPRYIVTERGLGYRCL